MMARVRDGMLPVLVLLALAAAPYVGFGDGFALTLLARAMILGMAAVGLSLLVGGAGLVSLGQAAMFGVGAYTVAALDAALADPDTTGVERLLVRHRRTLAAREATP